MATITPATTNQLKPFSFSTEKCPRLEFWRTYLQPIFFAGLLAFSFELQFKTRSPPIHSMIPWIFVLFGLALIVRLLWKRLSLFLNRLQADRTFTGMSPQLRMQIKTRIRPHWERFAAEVILTILFGVQLLFFNIRSGMNRWQIELLDNH